MTNVTNLRRDRAVAVRNGAGKVVKIAVGQTVNVAGFDAKRPFNQALADEGSIQVGGKVKEEENSESRGKDLQRELEEAQTLFKQAKDALAAANADVKANPDDGEKKKAKSLAVQAYKDAEKLLGEAQDAFDKG